MKIKIKDLGPIHCADIELKPLTIFLGQNNTGKTWTAYTIAQVLGEIGLRKYTEAYKTGKLSESYPPLDNAIKQLYEEGNAQINILDFIKEYYQYYLDNMAQFALQWLPEAMGTKSTSFKKFDFNIKIDNSFDKLSNIILESELDSKLSVSKKGEALVQGIKEPKNPIIYFYNKDVNISEIFPISGIREYITETVFAMMHAAIYRGTVFFPADRAALVPLLMEPLQSSKSPTDGDVGGKKETMRPIPYPILDFLRMMFHAQHNGSKTKRLEDAKKDQHIKEYIELSEILQQKILGGSLQFSTPEPEVKRDLLFQPSLDKDTNLDMPIVSSMVKGLSSLAIYLSYLAKEGQLIIIDEPEMNLHPEAQAKIIEFLSMLVNAGLQVIITTHSPYIIDHLINLMKANKIRNKENIKNRFYLKRIEAFIDQDDVSVYLFNDNEVTDILDKEGFIDWHTFSKESELISQLYFELQEESS